MKTDNGSGTSDSGSEILDTGLETSDLGHETRDLRCGIQDSFAGYKFEDVIKMDEKEKAEEKKRLEDIAREEEKRRKKDARGKNTGGSEEQKILQQSTNSRGTIWTINEDNAPGDLRNMGHFQVTIKNVRTGIETWYVFTKYCLNEGDTLEYECWQRYSKDGLVSNRFVPASMLDIHILARAAWENRNNDEKSPSASARKFLEELFTNQIENPNYAKPKVCFYSKAEKIETGIVKIVHSEGLKEQSSRIISTEHHITGDCEIPDSPYGPNFYLPVLNDAAQYRVERIYKWVCGPTRKKCITQPAVIDCLGHGGISSISIDDNLKKIFIKPSCYQINEPFRTIGVMRGETCKVDENITSIRRVS